MIKLDKILAVVTFCFITGFVTQAQATLIGDGSGGLWNLDVTTNTSTYIGNSGIGTMYDIALDPTTSMLYGVTGGYSLASINTTTGAGTIIGSTGAFINGLTFDSSGTLYGSGGSGLFTINLGSGAATLVGNTGFGSSGDLAFDSSGNLFLSASAAGPDQLVSVNTTTGAGVALGSIGYTGVYGLNFSGSTLYGFTAGGLTLSLNTATGAGTLVASNGINAYGADGVGGVTDVPEPSTLYLLGMGLLGLGLLRCKPA